MPINQENLKRIEKLKVTLRDQLLWLSRKIVGDVSETIMQVRNIRQFVIALSVAIIGIATPQLLSNEIPKNIADYLFVSMLLFALNVIIGIFSLFFPAHKEKLLMPKITSHHAEEALKMIQELDEIKKIDDNDEAGRRYQALQTKSTAYPMKELSLVYRLWLKYEDLVLTSLFICGFILLCWCLFITFKSHLYFSI